MLENDALRMEYIQRVKSLLGKMSFARKLQDLVQLMSGSPASVVFEDKLSESYSYLMQADRLRRLEEVAESDPEWRDVTREVWKQLTLALVNDEVSERVNRVITEPLPSNEKPMPTTVSQLPKEATMTSAQTFNRLYFLLLLLVIACVALLLVFVKDAKVEVQVTFEVGTIIAGILAGGGIAAAGAAYAARTLKEGPSPPDRAA